MIRAKLFGLAGAAALVSTASLAADLPPPPLLPPPVYAGPVITSGWYLRADVGVGLQRFSDFDHTQTNSNFVWPASWAIRQSNITDTTFVGFGVGYAWNNWLRFDVTGEYRIQDEFKVLGSYNEFCLDGWGNPATCFDQFHGHHSAWVALANAYVDLGTWWCLTPFIGAGVGGALHKFTGLTDIGLIADGSTGFGFNSEDSTKWRFAWAFHAGVAYNVTNNVKIELAYRYLNFGSIDTPVIDCAASGCMTNGPRAFYTLSRFDAQELKLGIRFLLHPEAPPPPPMLIRKG
jgi:opacity protein-like surface antigen